MFLLYNLDINIQATIFKIDRPKVYFYHRNNNKSKTNYIVKGEIPIMRHVISHTFICIFLLSTTLSRAKLHKKYANILFIVSSIYLFLYLLHYGLQLSSLMHNFLYLSYLMIYIAIIGFYLYLTFVFLDNKQI